MSQKPSYEQIEKRLRDLEIENAALIESQKKFADSEELHRAIIENISDTVVITDDFGKVTYVCPNTHLIFGLSPVEVYQLGTITALLNGAVCDISELKQNTEIKNIEWSIADGNGNEHFLLINVKSVNIQGGTILYTMRDVTNYKRIEQNVKEMVDRLALATRAARLGIWDWDIQKDELIWDDRMYELFGLTREAFPNAYEVWLKGLHPDDREKNDKILEQAKRGEREYDTEFRVEWPDGTVRFIKASGLVSWDAEGNPLRMTGINYDITELKVSEDALKKERNFSDNLIDTAQCIILVLDPAGRIVRFNAYMEQLSGYCLEDVKGKDWFSTFLPPGHSDELRSLFQKAIGDIQTRGNINPIITKDGRETLIEWYDKSLKDPDGNTVGLISIGQDVTERQKFDSEREITLRLLEAIHKENDLHTLVRDITVLMQNWSGCEAVGVRLQEKEDYPYFETKGFPPEFVKAERRLCAIDPQGGMIRDSSGNPVLECMCGNVICGRFNPELPFFTKSGSFWTNSTTELLASTTEADRQARKRNRCHGEGFESVALIPLRSGNQCLGLLQFNDPRRDRFDVQKIEVLERLASSLAMGLSQRIISLALRESENRNRSILQTAMDGFWLTDTQGNLIEVNEAYCRMSGYSEDELLTMRLADLEVVETPEIVAEYMQKVIMKGSDRFESKHRRKDGTVFDVEVSIQFRAENHGQYVCFLRDITERKTTELELLESEEKFRNFTEQSFVGFYIIQEDRLKYVNPKFAQIFGHTVDECQDNMSFRQLVHPEDRSKVEEQVRRRLTGEVKAVQYNFRGIKKSGETIHVTIYGSAFLYKGKPAAIGTMLDITNELELENRMAQAQRMESIGNLAGGIAHDFNNILFPIVGMAELLLEDLAPDSQEYANAEQIYRAGKRGSELVKQILAFSRQSEHKMMPVRIQLVLKEVVKLCRSTIPANIEINHNISTDCGMVMADATQIHQIAMNLITNAYHAVEPTSEKIFVQLRETALERDDVAHSLLQPGRYVMLSVSDTGCGIDPKILNKIFDPYFTTKEQGKGTGLGLAVVYGIVKEHHGDIKVYSEVGKGTTFNVYLPLMEESSEPVSVEKTESLSAGNEHILLVDDEEPILRLEKQILERLGYHVTSRISSVDALAAFKANPEAFDLAITDMTMPNMTGDQFARILLSMRTDLPIIICTGFSERITQEKAAAFGIKGLLKKPIVKSELARMIRKVLDEAKGSTEG